LVQVSTPPGTTFHPFALSNDFAFEML